MPNWIRWYLRESRSFWQTLITMLLAIGLILIIGYEFGAWNWKIVLVVYVAFLGLRALFVYWFRDWVRGTP